MKKLYLSSEIHFVAKKIMKDIKKFKTSFTTVFITTGSEVKENIEWVDDNRQGMVDAGFEVFDYTITGKTPEDIKNDLKDVDIVHMNGGSCKRIVEQARESGFDTWIKTALEKGVIYTGSSGGSIAAAPDISGIYRTKEEYPMGLNLAPIFIIPHWNRPDRIDLNLKERLPMIVEEKHKVVLLNDNQFIKVEGDEMEFFDVRGK